MSRAPVQIVAIADLAEYPLPVSARLDGNGFVKWQHSRWLNSTSFRKMSWEVQGMARALFDFCQMETPVGTLPDDDEELAFMLRIEARRLRELRAMEFGPLRHWVRCRVGDKVRLMHPVVLEQVQDALERRETASLSKEAKAEFQRLKRLREALEAEGMDKAVIAEELLIKRMDEWLQANHRGNRTRMAYRSAILHAHTMKWFGGPRLSH